jgi:hypothetical protein
VDKSLTDYRNTKTFSADKEGSNIWGYKDFCTLEQLQQIGAHIDSNREDKLTCRIDFCVKDA